jgi:hypothetical protein
VWPRGNTAAKITPLSECAVEPSGRLSGFVSRGACDGGAIVSDAQRPRAEYYRQRAEEIRQFARQSRFLEIGEELFELADRFDRMAVHLERWGGRWAGGPAVEH